MDILRTDKEKRLIRLFDRGDATAMDELYAEYADYLTGVCYRYIGNDDDLKDVLQETFIKIFTQITTFTYRGKGSLKAWMTRIVINEALMFIRRSKKLNEVEVKTEPPDSDAPPGGVEALPDVADEPPDTEGLDATAIMDMVARLPDGYRVVFNLFAIEGRSHKQIAEKLGITPGTSASQYHKARNMLAKMIREYRKDFDNGAKMD